jgi:hypothetical protein
MKTPPVITYFLFYMKRFILRRFYYRRHWVLCRVACLGLDSLAEIFRTNSRHHFNLQKGRADLLLQLLSGKVEGVGLRGFSLVSKVEMLKLIWRQNDGYFVKLRSPNFIVFDSFSDLTDVKFQSQASKSLYCHRSDLVENYPEKGIQNLGLLELSEVKDIYEEIFSNFQKLWGDVDIIYIHFPTELEHRSVYIDRAKQIETAIDILSRRFRNLHSIKVPSQIVKPKLNADGSASDFAYHFSAETKDYVANEIIKILKTQSINSQSA